MRRRRPVAPLDRRGAQREGAGVAGERLRAAALLELERRLVARLRLGEAPLAQEGVALLGGG
ncbi:MAG TPA: hypothetical protein VF894_09075, partial [Anaeromyxobacter sp.]